MSSMTYSTDSLHSIQIKESLSKMPWNISSSIASEANTNDDLHINHIPFPTYQSYTLPYISIIYPSQTNTIDSLKWHMKYHYSAFIYGLRSQEDIPRACPRCSHRINWFIAHEQAVGWAFQDRLPQKLQPIIETLVATQDSRHRGEPQGVTHRTAGPVFLFHRHRKADKLPRSHRVSQQQARSHHMHLSLFRQ